MSIFKDKVLLITGGTGSFGKAMLERLIGTDIREIRIFSRNGGKQEEMRLEVLSKHPFEVGKVRFCTGDVRSLEDCRGAMEGVDYVFHAAAMKLIPDCEEAPMDALRINVIGTDNVVAAAVDAGVEAVVCLSTDKAAYPINVMGLSKAFEERVAFFRARGSRTRVCCTRYGNVLMSQGSVIPLWISQIRQGLPVTLTSGEMTRFIMTLPEAVDLVLFALEHGRHEDILVQKSPACTIGTQAEAVCELFGADKSVIKVIGLRPGEKMYETLLTKEEAVKAEDMGEYYRVPFGKASGAPVLTEEFNSDNARRMGIEEMVRKIRELI